MFCRSKEFRKKINNGTRKRIICNPEKLVAIGKGTYPKIMFYIILEIYNMFLHTKKNPEGLTDQCG